MPQIKSKRIGSIFGQNKKQQNTVLKNHKKSDRLIFGNRVAPSIPVSGHPGVCSASSHGDLDDGPFGPLMLVAVRAIRGREHGGV